MVVSWGQNRNLGEPDTYLEEPDTCSKSTPGLFREKWRALANLFREKLILGRTPTARPCSSGSQVGVSTVQSRPVFGPGTPEDDEAGRGPRVPRVPGVVARVRRS